MEISMFNKTMGYKQRVGQSQYKPTVVKVVQLILD